MDKENEKLGKLGVFALTKRRGRGKIVVKTMRILRIIYKAKREGENA